MDFFSLLEQGIGSWNQWRADHSDEPVDLEAQDLSHGYFFEGDFRGANLRYAKLQRACLVGADFRGADLTGANLTGAYLSESNFYGANLQDADFTEALLDYADMRRANLAGTNLSDADISTAKLPAAVDESYASAVAMLMAQSQRYAGLSNKVNEAIAPQKTIPPTKPTQQAKSPQKTKANYSSSAAPAIAQPSAFEHIVRTIKNFTHESSEDFATRQQRIRQSAIPERRLSRDRRKNPRKTSDRRQNTTTQVPKLQAPVSKELQRLQPASASNSNTHSSLLSFLRKTLLTKVPNKGSWEQADLDTTAPKSINF